MNDYHINCQPLVPLALFVGAASAILLWATPAGAQKAFLAVAKGKHPIPEKIAKCHLCHEEGKGPKRSTLNDYGKALAAHEAMKPALGHKSSHEFTAAEQQAVLKAIEALDNEDADKDGATNKEEMVLGSLPGDAKSKPADATLKQYRDAQKAAEDKKKKDEAKTK